MKKYFLSLSLTFVSALVLAQTKALPSANVKTLEGQTLNIQDVVQKDKITVISFWAIWCSPCRKELDAISDYYDEWKEKYNVEVIALSIDDARTVANVRGVVEKHGWPFRVILDTQRELMLAMNVNNPPYMLVIDKSGNIVYEHLGYTPGDELELEEKFKAMSK
jgi:cytochrome c biogenesis protein CcmG, thiol:disulfide interchange protein DsbE